jgi:UPF0271 protein
VDLNVDLGELPDEPEELYALAHVANVACGGHAGDGASIATALARCKAHGTRVAAHPSYPDREGFGRRAMKIAPSELRDSVREQCARLASEARAAFVAVSAMKPHGALYHQAGADRSVAEAVIDGALEALGDKVTIVGPGGSALAAVALERGLPFAREGFADRGLRADGSLVPRGEPGALVTDPALAAAQALRLAASGSFDTVCVHGDTPGAVAIARAVREALDRTSRPA